MSYFLKNYFLNSKIDNKENFFYNTEKKEESMEFNEIQKDETMNRNFKEPHRGTMIFVFGIISIVCCFAFGIAAWIMGNTDLEKMKNGVMDPEGMQMTTIGRILGIVGICVFAGMIIINFVIGGALFSSLLFLD